VTDDTLALFEADPDPYFPELPTMMSAKQRVTIRDAFARLGITSAKEQFAVVEELTGERIASVSELDEGRAQTLAILLTNKVATHRRPNSGNSWADRDEPTWIDRL
jgi:DNA polymerase-3 subunit epsilon